MSEHGSRRAGGSRGAGGRRAANAGGVGEKLNDLAGQLSGMFSRRGGGRRGDDGHEYDESYSDGYSDYDDRGYDSADEVGAGRGSGRGGRGRGRASRGAGNGEPPPKDWWMKFIDYPRYGRSGWRHWMPSIKQILSLFLAFVFSLIGVVAYAYAHTEIPSAHHNIADGDPSVFYFDDGKTPIATIGIKYYEVKDINTIPLDVQNAFVAAENYSFWTDPGVSFTGVARSALNDLFGGGNTQGGSTITQQYVKNAYLSQDQTFARKVNEVLISIKLSHNWTKKEILLGYLNQISFGRGAYGIDAASRLYLGHPIADLAKLPKPELVSDAAFLAALVNDPSNFQRALANGNPDLDKKDNPKTFERFKQRYNAILANMSKYNFEPKPVTDPLQGNLPKYLKQATDDLSPYKGYLKEAAEAYLASQLATYPDDKQTQIFANIDNLSRGGYKIVTTYDDQMMKDSITAADALWRGQGVQSSNSGWSQSKHASDHDVHLAFASVDPSDGWVRSFYTGVDGVEDYSKNAFNAALQGGVQVGSTFKPITLATALETGQYSLDSLEPGSNFRPLYDPIGSTKESDHLTYVDPKSHETRNWPPNEDDEASGGPTGMATLKQGLALSLNSVFADLEMEPNVTPKHVHDMAIQLGIKDTTTDFGIHPSLTLGTAEITPMRMANVYSSFVNGGVAREPVQVQYIEDVRTHQKWYPPATRPNNKITKQVMQPNTAAGVTEALQDVLKEGTASGNPNAAKLFAAANGNLGGKTGTTDFNHSAWFTGFSSSLVTSVTIFRQTPNGTLESIKGLGYNDQNTRINGMDWPTSVWSRFMTIEMGNKAATWAKPFAPYNHMCTGVSDYVSPGQPVPAGGPTAGSVASGLPSVPGSSEPNCLSMPTPTPSPTPTPTTPSTTQSQINLPPACPPGSNWDPPSNQCVPVQPSTDQTLPPTPTDTGTSNTGPTTSSPSGNPSTTSTAYCKRHPTDPGCSWYTPTTTPTSTSTGPTGLPTGTGL